MHIEAWQAWSICFYWEWSASMVKPPGSRLFCYTCHIMFRYQRWTTGKDRNFYKDPISKFIRKITKQKFFLKLIALVWRVHKLIITFFSYIFAIIILIWNKILKLFLQVSDRTNDHWLFSSGFPEIKQFPWGVFFSPTYLFLDNKPSQNIMA